MVHQKNNIKHKALNAIKMLLHNSQITKRSSQTQTLSQDTFVFSLQAVGFHFISLSLEKYQKIFEFI